MGTSHLEVSGAGHLAAWGSQGTSQHGHRTGYLAAWSSQGTSQHGDNLVGHIIAIGFTTPDTSYVNVLDPKYKWPTGALANTTLRD